MGFWLVKSVRRYAAESVLNRHWLFAACVCLSVCVYLCVCVCNQQSCIANYIYIYTISFYMLLFFDLNRRINMLQCKRNSWSFDAGDSKSGYYLLSLMTHAKNICIDPLKWEPIIPSISWTNGNTVTQDRKIYTFSGIVFSEFMNVRQYACAVLFRPAMRL